MLKGCSMLRVCSVLKGVWHGKGVKRTLQEAVDLRERAKLLEPLADLRVRGRGLPSGLPSDLGLEMRQLRVE